MLALVLGLMINCDPLLDAHCHFGEPKRTIDCINADINGGCGWLVGGMYVGPLAVQQEQQGTAQIGQDHYNPGAIVWQRKPERAEYIQMPEDNSQPDYTIVVMEVPTCKDGWKLQVHDRWPTSATVTNIHVETPEEEAKQKAATEELIKNDGWTWDDFDVMDDLTRISDKSRFRCVQDK